MVTNKRVRCISCRFATVDESASENKWKAYECSSPESEYHKSLLNVDVEGNKQKRITWSGCEHGKKKAHLECKEDIG